MRTTATIALLLTSTLCLPGFAERIADRGERTSPELPAPIEGSTVDGDLRLDSAGHLAAAADTLRFFDWVLVSGAAADVTSQRRLVASAAFDRVGGSAAGEVVALFDTYLDFRRRAAEIAATASPAEGLDEATSAVQHLRREIFGAELAAGLFAVDEAREARAIVLANRHARSASDLELTMDDSSLTANATAVAAVETMEAERTLHAAGASHSEIDALRTERFGGEAAARLAELDAARATWNRRLADYRAELAQLDDSLAGQPLAAAVAKLRGEHFTGPELIRIEALDRLTTVD